MEYYQPVFAQLYLQMLNAGINPSAPPTVRGEFWDQIPDGRYSATAGRDLVRRYSERVEAAMAAIIGHQSIGYWLHVYRRVGPAFPGAPPQTVTLVRASVEAAIQKYGRLDVCNRIGNSAQVPFESVLRGALCGLEARSEFFRERVLSDPQWVLTDFGLEEMLEAYRVDALGYELWRCAASMRITGKGAPLVVIGGNFGDDRDDDLDFLVTNYDDRATDNSAASAIGVVWPAVKAAPVLIPQYNVGGVPLTKLRKFFRDAYSIDPGPSVTNFYWAPFDFVAFYRSHKPLEDAFKEAHGVSLVTVLAVLFVLVMDHVVLWKKQPLLLMRDWNRAYDPPDQVEPLNRGIRSRLPVALEFLSGGTVQDTGDLPEALRFLSLSEDTRDRIDVLLAGPHSIFLPYSDERVIIDYAWIAHRLHWLFFGVNPRDQNFKGDALEAVIQPALAFLPTKPCIGHDAESIQVDASFAVGRTLVIVEAKANSKSLGFERGDPQAIGYRTDKMNIALRDVDAKAQWLASRPVGTNYNVTSFDSILPVVVTPFVEYIPSKDERYWLTPSLPRVLTPNELKSARESGILSRVSQNLVRIEHGDTH